MIIKRPPKLNEVSYKTYREFYKDCLRYSTSDHSVFKTILDNIPTSSNVVPQEEFKVFEYTLQEVKDAYLLELENKIEEIDNLFQLCGIYGISEQDYLLRKIKNLTKRYL